MSLMFANHYQWLYIEDIVQNQTYQQRMIFSWVTNFWICLCCDHDAVLLKWILKNMLASDVTNLNKIVILKQIAILYLYKKELSIPIVVYWYMYDV